MSENALKQRIRQILTQQARGSGSIRGGVYAGAIKRKPVMRKRVALKYKKRTLGGKSQSPWIQHVKSVYNSHPHMSYKDALIEASRTYRKMGSGGAYAGRKRATRRVSRTRGGVVIGASKKADYISLAKKLLKMAK